MSRRYRRIAAIAAVLAAAGCANGESREVQELTAEAAETVTPDTAVFVADAPRETLPSSRIYYTLTRHEWYARGEPLVHEGRRYQAGGMPVRAELDEMRHLGDYHGVEYYAREDGSSAVYVPVFEGYWQPFPPDTTPDTAATGT